MLRIRSFVLVLAFLLPLAAVAQKPADVLVARIKKETAIQFTHKVKHQKSDAKWAVVVLDVKPKDQATDNAKVLGLLYKQAGKWTVLDYVLGTAIQDAPKKMQRVHKYIPKSLYPKKI